MVPQLREAEGTADAAAAAGTGAAVALPLLLSLSSPSPLIQGVGSVSPSRGAEQPVGIAGPLLPTEQSLHKDQGTAGMHRQHCSDVSFINVCCTQWEAQRKLLK